MQNLLGQLVFSVDTEEYRWEDVVLHAELTGAWPKVVERARQGVAALRSAEESEGFPEDEEVESAASEFRYARDLVSSEEMEAWLSRWGLTVEEWMDYIRWSLLRSADIGAQSADPAATSVEEGADRSVQIEAVCSGDLERFARELAGRVAAAGKGAAPASDAEVEEVLRGFPGRRLESGLLGIAPGNVRKIVERLARLEVFYRRFQEEVLTPRELAALIRSRRIEWTRLDLHCVSFPDEQMAREAALCVREDGQNLSDVAADARRELAQSTKYVEEIEPAVLDGFLGARKGEVLGPFREREEFVLYQIVDKTLPSARDAVLTGRAQEAVLKLHLDREINDRVKWARPT